MIRLIAIILATVFCLSMSYICDARYPIQNDYFNNLWDAWKHVMYLCFAFLMGVISYFKSESKYRIVTIMNDVSLSFLMFGIIPTMILEKDQNRFKPSEPKDYYILIGSLIAGFIFTYARKTKTNPN